MPGGLNHHNSHGFPLSGSHFTETFHHFGCQKMVTNGIFQRALALQQRLLTIYIYLGSSGLYLSIDVGVNGVLTKSSWQFEVSARLCSSRYIFYIKIICVEMTQREFCTNVPP